jgi:peptidoglycan/xylan/chitin deacetylase (PgdA/CDA1 family)
VTRRAIGGDLLTTTAYRAVRLLGLPALSRRFRRGGIVLCYHNVVGDAVPSGEPSLHIAIHRFESQIRWLTRYFEFVSLNELMTRMCAGKPMRGLASLTFDDGYAGFFRWGLPLLRVLKLPSATLLVADAADDEEVFWWDRPEIVERATEARRSHWLGAAQGSGATILALEHLQTPVRIPDDRRPASWELVRASLGPDVTVGAHTVLHRCLPTLADADLRWELDACARSIDDHLGCRPTVLAYPYGAWDARVREAAVAAGYTLGLTLDAGRVSPGSSDQWALPRINIPAGISDDAFEVWVSGLIPSRG